MNTQHEMEDPYRAAARLPYPARCPTCTASYSAGRWSWRKAPVGAAAHVCPACQRIADELPGGCVTLRGAFFDEHRDEVIRFIKAHEARTLNDHPLRRIMGINKTARGLLVTTTDAHLARGIAHALQENFKGDMRLTFSSSEDLLRATWSR